jgi:hypothetical protein
MDDPTYQNDSKHGRDNSCCDEIEENPFTDLSGHTQLQTSDRENERRNNKWNDDALKHLKSIRTIQF